MNSRKVTTVLLIVVFLLLNWLSYNLYLRFDLSRTGRFRLTSATKRILKKIPDQVTLEAFFSGKVPDAYLQQVKLSKDFLKEYASASDGRVRLVFIDPDASTSSKERVQALNVPQSQISVQGESELEVKRIYLAVALSYGDDIQIIQNVVNTRFLEYELTSKIYRMAYPGERGIAFLDGRGSRISLNAESPIESLELANTSFESFYGKMETVNASEQDIPANITTLLVVGPASLSSMEQYRIDQFIMRGGNVIFSVSGMVPDLGRGTISIVSPEVTDFLKHYGFTIGADMLFEPKNFLPIRRPYPGNPFFTQEIPYPIWLFAKGETLSEEHVTTAGVPGLFFPWVSSLRIDEKALLEPAKEKKGVLQKGKKGKIIVLAKTSKEAWSHSDGPLYLAPQIISNLLKDTARREKNKGTFNLAGYADGRFASYFSKGGQLPEGVSRNYLKESEKRARIMVVPTSYFLTNQFVQLSQQANMANLSFVLSVIDVMNGLEELVESRSKDISEPILPVLEAVAKRVWTMLNFLIPLGGIVGVGLLRFFIRRKITKKVYSV